MSKRILITGITGFMGGLISQKLISQGRLLRGTMKSLSVHNQGKLKKLFPTQNLEVVQCALEDTNGWLNATKDCHTVINLALPRIQEWRQKSSRQLYPNIINGTKALYNACLQNKVEKFIHTSVYSTAIDASKKIKIFDGNDWNKCKHPLMSTKLDQEIALWELYNANPNATQLTTINMGTVYGHCVYSESNMGLSLLISIITGEKVPNIPIGLLGADDAVDVICKCIDNPISNGKRYLTVEQCMLVSELAEKVSKIVMSKTQKDVSYKCMSNWSVKWLDFVAKSNYYSSIVNQHIEIDSSQVKQDLGIKLNTVDSIIDSLLDHLVTRIKL
jgi:nucleoside-diphosphate-sugar epimerase